MGLSNREVAAKKGLSERADPARSFSQSPVRVWRADKITELPAGHFG
jgi:hypothetical protein